MKRCTPLSAIGIHALTLIYLFACTSCTIKERPCPSKREPLTHPTTHVPCFEVIAGPERIASSKLMPTVIFSVPLAAIAETATTTMGDFKDDPIKALFARELQCSLGDLKQYFTVVPSADILASLIKNQGQPVDGADYRMTYEVKQSFSYKPLMKLGPLHTNFNALHSEGSSSDNEVEALTRYPHSWKGRTLSTLRKGKDEGHSSYYSDSSTDMDRDRKDYKIHGQSRKKRDWSKLDGRLLLPFNTSDDDDDDRTFDAEEDDEEDEENYKEDEEDVDNNDYDYSLGSEECDWETAITPSKGGNASGSDTEQEEPDTKAIRIYMWESKSADFVSPPPPTGDNLVSSSPQIGDDFVVLNVIENGDSDPVIDEVDGVNILRGDDDDDQGL